MQLADLLGAGKLVGSGPVALVGCEWAGHDMLRGSRLDAPLYECAAMKWAIANSLIAEPRPRT